MLGPDSHFQLILLFGAAISLSFFTLDEWQCMMYGLVLPIGCVIGLELTDFAPVLGAKRAVLTTHELMVLRLSTTTIVWSLVIGLFVYHVRARARSQEQMISSAKLVALGQMAAGIAHEVNNPLTSIVSNAQLLADMATKGNKSPEEIDRVSGRLFRTSMRIAAIVRGLLTLSRDASGDSFLAVPVRRIVELTLDLCRARIEAAGVELRVGAIEESLAVTGREAQLSEVLLNVMNNALYAALELEEQWIEIGVRSNSTHVEILVTDSGRGIPRDIQRRMFDPFFTSKPVGKGTGLGLSISRAIMNAHQGQLEYDAASDRTRFVMRVRRNELIGRAPEVVPG
jgi:C4-dicarboxylate-specific signal transduction histidine kinase